MRLYFFGTGPAEGIPALFCACALCEAARRRGGRDLRTRASVLIEDAVRIDLPPDALAQAHRNPCLPMARLEHLVFTHSHDDHFAIREIQYLAPTFAPARCRPLHIWLTPDCRNELLPVFDRFFEQAPVVLHLLEPFQQVQIGPLFVTPLVARHKEDELCLNLLVTDAADAPALLYASDTGWYPEVTWEFLRTQRLRAVTMECGNGTVEDGYAGHLSLRGCVKARQRLTESGTLPPGAPFLLTHLSHAGGMLHDCFQERVAPFGMTVAYDGLTIDL